MYYFYVSAQTADNAPLDKGENLAMVINAISWPGGDVVFPYFRNVVTAKGYWHGELEHTVILTVSDSYPSDVMERHAEKLRQRLGQESVMVVSDTPIADWIPVYRNDRIDTRSTMDYTLRDGMGQRPYEYLECPPRGQRTPTHWVHFANRH